MLPYIDDQERLAAAGEWQLCVAGLDHRELVAVEHKPRPTAAELAQRRGSQLDPTVADATLELLSDGSLLAPEP